MGLLLILAAAGLLGLSALLAALCGRRDRAALWFGSGGALLGCGLGLVGSVLALQSGAGESIRLAWTLPAGEFHIGIDPLSAFFLLAVFLVSGLAACYGHGYLQSYIGRQRLAPAVALYNLLVLTMVGVALARDAILFLIVWEGMTISSFFLVTYEDGRQEVRQAGFVYLVASHLGTVFLIVLFMLLYRVTGSYDFEKFTTLTTLQPKLASGCFLLALIGLGTKAGFWPLHVWLPEAHPAAPSHVSAVMSGVMIKMGIYGLLRVLTFLGTPPGWWGGTLIAVGVLSGVSGVLHALAQHDLKRLLAYHSVENIGIIALGIGIGLLGLTHHLPVITFLGFSGALLHVLNHGIFKGLLFEGAGSVLHATGTRDIESLGGLSRRMPATALTFLVGSIAICGLPPLNGFVSEWLIYVGAFRGRGAGLPTIWTVTALVAVPALALIGGLAAACFVKAFGVVFLGEPRTPAAQQAHEANSAMRVPLIFGALLCLGIGLWPAGAVRLVAPAVLFLGQMSAPPLETIGPLSAITRGAALLLFVIGVLVLLRTLLLRGRTVTQEVTWGCGYEAPSPRMQYSAASFAQPLLAPFTPLLHVQIEQEGPTAYFPTQARYEEHLGDLASEGFLMPASRRLVQALLWLRFIQQGRLHLYLVYIAATLVALLVWQLMGVGL